MKINVSVDLSDLFTNENEYEEGQSFTEAIKKAVIYEVKSQVLAQFKTTAQDQFSDEAKRLITEEKQEFISGTLRHLISEKKIRKSYSSKSDELITVEEYITEEIQRTHLNGSEVDNYLRKIVDASAKKIGEELTKRYDLLFASQIVTKLNDNGMLKEDVARILLGN